MEWIRRNTITLGVVLVVSGSLCALELLWTRSVEEFPVEPWQLGLLMLPWFTTAGALLSLTYLLWFGAGSGAFTGVGKLLFWAITIAFAAMFGVLYGSLVFGVL